MNIKKISNNTYLLINWFISYRFNWWFIHYRYQWLLPECSRHTLSYTTPVTSVELTADLSLFWIQISLSLLLHSVNIRYNVMHVPHNQNIKYALFSINITCTLNKKLGKWTYCINKTILYVLLPLFTTCSIWGLF